MMVGLICGERPLYNANQIPVALNHGEQLIVHEELGPPIRDEAPLTILVHGLGGDHTSPYLQRIAQQLRAAGQRVWRVDLRGCGAGLPLAWRPAHAGASHDLASVLAFATHRFPKIPIRMVGFSLSGNILLKMLGEAASGAATPEVDLSRVERAIAVAPPVDLQACSANMGRFSRKVYTYYYLKVLAKQVEQRRNYWEQWSTIPTMPPVKSIRDFDSRYTAPLGGFRNVDAYYRSSGAKQWLSKITTPTLLLVDRHDPIVTFRSFAGLSLETPRAAQEQDEQTGETNLLQQSQTPVASNPLKLHLTSRGGHMGYFGLDATGRMIRWMEHFVVSQLTGFTR